jgi:DNA repair exonuclease SbcCD ATPase subunit
LQGEQVGKNEWRGKQIEIDAIHVQYGIKPFVDYIESRLEDIACWDLTRIGIGKQELFEPPNEYENLIQEKEDKAIEAYKEKLEDISENYSKILSIVENTLTQPTEYLKLRKEYFTEDNQLINIEPLRLDYMNQIDKKWVNGYQSSLDKHVNDKLKCWNGAVNTASDKILAIKAGLQSELDKAKTDDPDLDDFKDDLEDIDWGEQELKAIPTPDPVEEVLKVIKSLLDYLKELKK